MPDDYPATVCLVEIIKASTERLKAMKLETVADHYGVDIEWVRFNRDWELTNRGQGIKANG